MVGEGNGGAGRKGQGRGKEGKSRGRGKEGKGRGRRGGGGVACKLACLQQRMIKPPLIPPTPFAVIIVIILIIGASLVYMIRTARRGCSFPDPLVLAILLSWRRISRLLLMTPAAKDVSQGLLRRGGVEGEGREGDGAGMEGRCVGV